MSPDGTWIVSASGDSTLRIWDVASGAGPPSPAILHQSAPIVVWGDRSGAMHRARLAGVELGRLVVTAAARGRGRSLRCPACRCRA